MALEAEGRPIRAMDLLIAAHAIHERAMLAIATRTATNFSESKARKNRSLGLSGIEYRDAETVGKKK
jgi:predicted nucleic acid-binding protein